VIVAVYQNNGSTINGQPAPGAELPLTPGQPGLISVEVDTPNAVFLTFNTNQPGYTATVVVLGA
jgi:hypothetical protein